MKEGFLIGGGLIIVGLLLQLAIGPVDWRFFAAPVNYIVMALLLALICAMFLLRKKVYAFEWMMHFTAAVPCLCYATGLTIVMGLTVQTRHGGIPWLSQMLQFWPFVLIWTWMMVIAGLAALNHLLRWKWREIPFIVNHLGVFLAIVCATLGNADMQELQMTVFEGARESMAVDENGKGHELDLAVELHDFSMDRYENGAPKRFASDVSVHTKRGQTINGTVEVNKPLKAESWKIYQYDYDARRGPESQYSVFLLVRDPWLPGVYLGIFLMLAGALWAKEAWGNYWSWDPKETWAAITWLCYLVYLHFRKARPSEWRTACWMLLFAFVCLQLCWWGINYLPSAQGNSVHTYNS